MPSPNQLTACSMSSLQGRYFPCVRMYDTEAHPEFGLLYRDYYVNCKTRDRDDAIKHAREVIKQIKALSADEQRAYLKANLLPNRPDVRSN